MNATSLISAMAASSTLVMGPGPVLVNTIAPAITASTSTTATPALSLNKTFSIFTGHGPVVTTHLPSTTTPGLDAFVGGPTTLKTVTVMPTAPINDGIELQMKAADNHKGHKAGTMSQCMHDLSTKCTKAQAGLCWLLPGPKWCAAKSDERFHCTC